MTNKSNNIDKIPLIFPILAFVLVSPFVVPFLANEAQAVQVVSTTNTSGSMQIRLRNDSGELVDQVEVCTDLVNASDFMGATFLDFWTSQQYTSDWDSDGTPEICYRFGVGSGAEFASGTNADVVLIPSGSINPQAMELANGTNDAPGNVRGQYVSENFTAPTPDPNSVLTVTANNGTVTGTGIDTGTGDNTETKYWGSGNTVLTATADTGHEFTSWTDCPSVNGNECTWGDGTTSITANFTPFRNDLEAIITGNGTVTSNPSGINAPGDNTETYNYGDIIQLTATPDTGYRLDSTSGEDSISGNVVTQTMDQNVQDGSESVTFNFVRLDNNLVVNKGGNGDGEVTSSPAGIDTGIGDNSEAAQYGDSFTLTATPATGSYFTSWVGADDSTGSSNVQTLDQNTQDGTETVTANFTLYNNNLNVSTSGTGSGTVTGTGIDTGEGDSATNGDYGTQIVLTATPANGSIFTGWSGCDDTSATTCTQTLDRDLQNGSEHVIAEFSKSPTPKSSIMNFWPAILTATEARE